MHKTHLLAEVNYPTDEITKSLTVKVPIDSCKSSTDPYLLLFTEQAGLQGGLNLKVILYFTLWGIALVFKGHLLRSEKLYTTAVCFQTALRMPLYIDLSTEEYLLGHDSVL